MLSCKLDFNSCAIRDSFCKSGHILILCSYVITKLGFLAKLSDYVAAWFLFVEIYRYVITTRVEIGLGRSTYLDRMGHFSFSHAGHKFVILPNIALKQYCYT